MKKAKKYLVMFMTMVFMLSVSQLVYAKEAGSARAERTLRLCKDEHTTISFSYQTKEFKCEVDNPEAELYIHKTSTSQTSSGGQYDSSTTMEISFGTIGEYVLTISDDNDELIVDYAVIISDHEWVDGVVVKEPTCTENGVIEYTCQNCGIVQENTEELTALGHEYPEEWTIDQEATCTETGRKSKHCIRCDNQSEITVIEKKNIHGRKSTLWIKILPVQKKEKRVFIAQSVIL